MKVWIATWTHKHGTDTAAFATEQLALAWKTGIAKEWWSHEFRDPPPDDDEIADAYFDRHCDEGGAESFDLGQYDVEGDAQVQRDMHAALTLAVQTLSGKLRELGLGAVLDSASAAVTEGRPATVELFSFDYADSNLGAWSRDWFLTKSEAEKARAAKIEALGVAPDDMEMDGSYGDVEEVTSITIELTPEGLLDFVERHATGVDGRV